MLHESSLLGIDVDPEIVAIAKQQMMLITEAQGDDELTNPLAIQMVTLDVLKVIYRRQEFVTAAELEVAVSEAFAQLTSMEAAA